MYGTAKQSKIRRNEAIPGERELRAWRAAGVHTGWITLLVLELFYVWFAVANRYVIFLYGHLGATPFDAITRSRYWMAGLVAAGVIGIGYTALQWLLGWAAARRRGAYRAPAWWRVWLLCVFPVGLGVGWITTHSNWPVLPPRLALGCAAATLTGLALALLPGATAAQQPRRLIWLMLYGMGVVPSLLLVRAVELPGQIGAPVAYTVALAAVLGGALWLLLLSRLHVPRPTPVELSVAALGLTYLALPLLHYLFFAPPQYRYITTAANFFAHTPAVQLLTFLVAGGLVYAATRQSSLVNPPS